jgi:hypothetical protein
MSAAHMVIFKASCYVAVLTTLQTIVSKFKTTAAFVKTSLQVQTLHLTLAWPLQDFVGSLALMQAQRDSPTHPTHRHL